MNSNIPANRNLLNITLLTVLSPIYAIVLFAPHIGLLQRLSECWSRGAPFAAPLTCICVLTYLASIVWLLRRDTIMGPVTILLITMIATMMISGYYTSNNKTYELSIGAGRPILGIDVYCNDVHLGKTPLTISEAEFIEKVTPWDTPPEQPIMIVDEDDDDDRYSWAKLFYVPQDIFEMSKQWPPDHMRYNRHNDKETLEDFKNSKYWWRFEKDGCVGLTGLRNFGGGNMSGSNGRVVIRVNPSITFISAEKHLDALMVQLLADKLQPTKTWLDHFIRYKDLLFMQFHKRSMSDDSLQQVLDAIVRAEFDIPADPSEYDCRRVVNEIIKRADKSRCFTVPSPESLAIEMVAKAHSQPIVDRFVELANLSPGGSQGAASSDIWTTFRRSGSRAQLLPLEYAVKQTTPAQLFDRLVYMSRKESNMVLLGNYPREELINLFHNYFTRVKREGGRMRESHIHKALEICVEVRNPLLEETLRRFVRENAGQGHGPAKYFVHRFVESRIKDPTINQQQLAAWIYHWAPIDDGTKLQLLPKIQDPNVYNYLYNVVGRNERQREEVSYQLGVNPNSALDKFIIDTYNWYLSPRGPGYWSTSLTYAIVKTDTPIVRGLIKEKWNQSDKTRSRMISHLNLGSWRQPNMSWLVPMIAKLSTKHERTLAAKLLSKIDTPEAYELAEKWATDKDPDVVMAAAEQLKICDLRAVQTQQQLAQAVDLLSGKIEPDDLLIPSTTYKWNGVDYIPDNVTK
ncbi:MAG: HEAT repeat domain-containing protein [Planctomycetes bacterium]|nr:HEAT repeat domain-containing protein [Planctomycetota bacterium]